MLFISASSLKTSRPPSGFMGPVALCLFQRRIQGRRRIITLFIVKIFIKDFKPKSALLSLIVFSGKSKYLNFLWYILFVNLKKDNPGVILLLHNFVK